MKLTVSQLKDGTPGKMLFFYCPGCKCSHAYQVDCPAPAANWNWNGSLDRPTFTPSLLAQHTYRNGKPTERCHLFMTDGKIRYLNDCTHELAGQTIDVPDWEEE